MLHLEYDITGLKGAEYNPRRIEDADLERLASSIKELGLVKPLIVRGDLLVAGHQRTKALRRLGVTKAPVYVLNKDTTTYDEVRFNQLHNGTDMDGGDEDVKIAGGFAAVGYEVVDSNRIKGNFRSKLANVRVGICELIVRYGAWGGVVATKSGRVIHAAQYALAAALTRTPLTCFVIEDADEAKYRGYLDRQYGVFSYDHLQKDTFIQTLAQMNRLRVTKSGKENKSTLYESMVIPYAITHRKLRYIDFGSGWGDYARSMRKQGFHYHDVELFRRNNSRVLDIAQVGIMLDGMIHDLTKLGPYDVTVLDSVLNSVDCVEAESAVLTVTNMLTRKGGRAFLSGRRMENVEAHSRSTKRADTQARRYVEFLDKDGFTAIYRDGHWFYQKYHTAQGAADLAKSFGFSVARQAHTNTSFQLECVKERDLELESVLSACDYEFNMDIGNGQRLGRHEDVKNAVKEIYGCALVSH